MSTVPLLSNSMRDSYSLHSTISNNRSDRGSSLINRRSKNNASMSSSYQQVHSSDDEEEESTSSSRNEEHESLTGRYNSKSTKTSSSSPSSSLTSSSASSSHAPNSYGSAGPDYSSAGSHGTSSSSKSSSPDIFAIILRAIQDCCCCCCNLYERHFGSSNDDALSDISLGSVALTKTQHTRVSALRASLAQPFDATSDDHKKFLVQLGQAAFNDSSFSISEAESSTRWKRIGFQSEKASSDFRGGGIASAHHLLYFIQTQRRAFESATAREEAVMTSSELEYFLPWACTGINLTHALSNMLLLKSKPSLVPTKKQLKLYQAFLQLLENDEHAFEELYACFFQSLLDEWVDSHARYMEFQSVLKRVQARLEQALLMQPPAENIREFQRRFANVDVQSRQ